MKKVTKKIILGLGLAAILAIGADCSDINLRSCSSCHGTTFEKKALGKSKIVKDISATKISEDLIAYKKGTLNKYGMGSVMKGQVAKYSDKELTEMSLKIKGE